MGRQSSADLASLHAQIDFAHKSATSQQAPSKSSSVIIMNSPKEQSKLRVRGGKHTDSEINQIIDRNINKISSQLCFDQKDLH